MQHVSRHLVLWVRFIRRISFVLFVCLLFALFCFVFFFFNDTATTEIYTLSLHDALPISPDYEFIVTDDCYGWLKYDERFCEEIAFLLTHLHTSSYFRRKLWLFECRPLTYSGDLWQIGRAHVWTPVTRSSRMPSSAWKKKTKKQKQKQKQKQIVEVTTTPHTHYTTAAITSILPLLFPH